MLRMIIQDILSVVVNI